MSPRSKIAISAATTVGLFVSGALWCRETDFGSVGNLFPTLVLFPFSVAALEIMAKAGLALDTLHEFRTRFIQALWALQFAIYGFFIGRAWLRGRARKAAAIVCGVHAAAALLAIGLVFR